MKFTQVPADAYQNLQLNAGILVSSFTPASGVIGDLLGATTGGITFASNPEYEDFASDVDNAPRNTKEMKRVVGYDPAMSGTFLTVSASMVKTLIGSADVAADKVTPRMNLEDSDFKDLWWIGDYSDKNTGENAGFLAIHLINALNTNGFNIKSNDKGKGNFAFDFHAHYSLGSPDVVPFEIYCKEGK